MATRHSWLATTVFLVIVFHLSLPEAQGCDDKKNKKKGGYDCCDPCYDPCFPWNPYYGPFGFPPYYGGMRGKYGPWQNGCYGNYYNDCCDGYYNNSGKKKDKKRGKMWKKLFKNRGKGNKKNKNKGLCGCGGQTVIVRNGPAIIQTVIVDKDVYSKYCSGQYQCNSPLQKVCIEGEGRCIRAPPRYSCFNDFEPQRVVLPDPCCRNFIGDPYNNYPCY